MRAYPRRDFLRLTIVTATGVFPGIGCSSDDEASPQRALQNGERFFPQSLASGDPKPASVVLWTRVQDSEREGVDLVVELEVAKDRGFTQLVQLKGTPSLKINAETAAAGCVKVRVEGLD